MCGIAGILPVRREHDADALASIAAAMAGTLAHRGPDDHGAWADPDGRIALGQTRLAVVDLTHEGHQPMVSSDGRLVAVFNGEIYDFPRYRAELQGLGVRFRGTSDTEVLVEAMARWGIAATLERCDGMFALAVWDRDREELTLARDRFGEKPLYYGWTAGAVVFGSELKALERMPRFAPEIDRAALADFLRFGYVPAPATIYRDVQKLPPGHLVTLRPDAPRAEPRAFWSLDEHLGAPRDGGTRPVGAVLDELDDRLRASVSERMIADVPLGAFLSGGIDSSLIVALMQAQSGRPVRTFTIAVPFEGYDESAAARAVARHLGTDHTELEVSADDALGLVPVLPGIYDEPFADSSQIPTLLVSRLAREHVTVALSGDGGDELFGGYVRYLLARSVWQRLARVPLPARRAAAALLARTPDAVIDRLGHASGLARPIEKAAKAVDVLAQPDITGVYRRLVSAWTDPGAVVLGAGDAAADPAVWTVRAGLSPLEWMMAVDTVTYLPDDILTKVDRASMCHSLEVRVPFLDPDVVAFAWSLPEELKVRGGTTKWILRELLARYVPRELFERPKMGFAVPVGQWIRGPLRPWAEDLLSEERLRAEGYLVPAPIRSAWDEHQRGERDHEVRLWNVLMFQAWLERRPRLAGTVAR